MYPSWAVSLMTMSGSCRYAACCCSLVSKSSYSATSLALTPVRRLKSFTIRVAVAAAAEPGGSRIHTCRTASGFCRTFSTLVEEHPLARAAIRKAAQPYAARRCRTVPLLFTRWMFSLVLGASPRFDGRR